MAERSTVSNHTPGPWFVEAHGIMDAARSRTICIFGDSDQDDADLALVASAPRLRAALERIALVDPVDDDGLACWNRWPNSPDRWCPACIATEALK